jgi:hypothetical protein
MVPHLATDGDVLTVFTSFNNRSISAREKLLTPTAFVFPFFWHSTIALYLHQTQNIGM